MTAERTSHATVVLSTCAIVPLLKKIILLVRERTYLQVSILLKYSAAICFSSLCLPSLLRVTVNT